MSEVTVGCIGLLLLLVSLLTEMEVAFVMAVIGFLGFSYIVGVQAALDLLAKDFYSVFTDYGFTVIPLFILMGQTAYEAGIARKLYTTAYRFLGHIPGGLSMATVLGAAAFGSVTGSTGATAATFGVVAFPEMKRFGYSPAIAAGTIASVGTLGSLIPPSTTLIVYGIISETSIGKLFLAGTIPGIIATLFMFSAAYIWCRIDPTVGPKGERSSWKERIISLKEVVLIVCCFLCIVGGLTYGFFTPTEAGAVGCLVVLLLSIVKRDITFRKYLAALQASLRTATMILILLVGSTIFGHFLLVTEIPMVIGDWISQLPLPRFVVMIIILVAYEIGGSFIDDLAFMVLATPIFIPLVLKLGYDPIWFGIILHFCVMIGVIIPPVAMNVFIVNNMTKVPAGVIYKGVTPFLCALLSVAVLLFLFPDLAMFLPSHLMK